jgi:energy-converting hydrogenase A subunit M
MTKNLVDKEAYQFDILQLLAETLIQIQSEMVSYGNRSQVQVLFSIHSEVYQAYVELLKQYLDVEEGELCCYD